ncbi:MAG: YezD family protein [Pontiellaceae bacterium]|nr:YezD family protein [Pontiellaceae bacterium]MBN2786656.1 YezD family protein [Pontiellaceae bacterium]
MKSINDHKSCPGGTYCDTHDGRWVKSVKDYVKSLSYGEISITVHDGHVVQVQKTEKVRFN